MAETSHSTFKSASTSIALVPMGRNPISGTMDIQVIKSIVAVDSIGRVWEWGQDKWVLLEEKHGDT